MINICNGTNINATFLCGNDSERILIWIFLVLCDSGTLLTILCYGLNFNIAITNTLEMRLYDQNHGFW